MAVKSSIILVFYKSYFIASFIASLLCAYLFFKYGIKAIGTLFWIKIFSDAVIVLYINNYKSKEFYYYRNLGLSRKVLWTISLIIDFLVFVILVVLASLIKRCIH
jgi:hypothetical protein